MPKWEMWKKDYRGLIAKFIIFVFVNMRLIFVLLPQVNVKGWTLWNWARGNLANEFLYGGTCPIEIDGKTCSTICRKFYCNKKTFSKMMNTCFTFNKKWKYCKKNWDWHKKRTYYLLFATSLPMSAMFVELSILEPMRKFFPPCAKMRKKIEDWNGKRTHCRILATSLSRLAATSTDRPPLDKFCITFISTPASLSHFFQPENLLSVVKKKRTFLEALWQSPASLSLAQQLLLFCLGPEKDPDKSCDMVFYHELRSSHSFLFDLVSKSTVEKSDTFFSRQTQSWIIFRKP